MNDLKLTFRRLGKNLGFTLIAVLILALGIGANVAIFSILLKPLKIPHPEQLAGLYQHDRDNPDAFSQFSYPDFLDLRSAKEVAFTDLFAFRFSSVGLEADLTRKIPACFVSANYFAALGVSPTLGRAFVPEEESSGEPVAVLTYEFWRQLGGDPTIVGRKIKLIRAEATVIGVMPRGFTGAQVLAPAIFFPVGMVGNLNPNPGQMTPSILTDRSDRVFMIMGRLKPGVSLANANAALAPLNQQFAVPDPASNKPRILVCASPSRFSFTAQPTNSPRGLAPIASFASGLSLLVLLVACLNLANMMLARGTARRKDIAIRLALGASRSQILRELLSEGVVLALLGGGAGLMVSLWTTNLLSAFIYSGPGMPPDFPKFDLSPDWRVLLSLFLVSGLATLVFALGPAWNLTRLEASSDLKRREGDATSGSRLRAREFLAVGQMAVALALLVAAALFTRSAMNIVEATPGFEFGSNFYLGAEPTLAGYSETRARRFTFEALDRLASLPGVESASAASSIPFGNSWNIQGVQRGGAPPPPASAATLAEGKPVDAIYNVVGAHYFRTMGIPLQRGREFESRETVPSAAPPVAIISQTLADQLFPGQEALGRSIQFAGPAPTIMTVVGIAPTVHWRLFKNDETQVYVPLGQDFIADLKLHVRVAPGVDPVRLMKEARAELRRLDPQVPVTELKTLAGLHHDGPTVRVARLGSGLFSAFGGLALLLSLLGIYGLKAYNVARRTRELGIRLALGATRPELIAMLLRESFGLAILGLGFGLVLAFGVGRLANGFLYRVEVLDPLTFCVIPPLLLAAMLLGCFIPARRAASVDPMEALRYE